MKKLISCLLVFMMLFSAVSSFAEAARIAEKSNVLAKFLDETDFKTKDIALQFQNGDASSDIVFRADGDHLHFVTRTGGKVDGHLQLDSSSIYLDSDGSVTQLRYSTIAAVLNDVAKELESALTQLIQTIPAELIPSEADLQTLIKELGILASMEAAQQEKDAATLGTAAMSFANKFKPEYVLDVNNDNGAVVISLRSEAFATALAEAVDEMLSDPALAELVDRHAAQKGGMTFVEMQKDWLKNREATLEAIRTIKSTEVIEENGHSVSHFEIGEENSEKGVLCFNTDSFVNVDNGEIEFKAGLGFHNEDPAMIYEFTMTPYFYWEKVTAGDTMAEVKCNVDFGRFTNGKLTSVVDGKENLRVDFGPDYLYAKGPKGGISTSVRETWTGKIRYEIVAESAEGEEVSITVDFFEDGDSLVCELFTDKAEDALKIKLSRIDKVDIKDLSTSDKITEITIEDIKALVESISMLMGGSETK
jgi:hypothetical protein